MNHGVAQRKRLNLGNLNPIYKRELTKLGVYQEEGRRKVANVLRWLACGFVLKNAL